MSSVNMKTVGDKARDLLKGASEARVETEVDQDTKGVNDGAVTGATTPEDAESHPQANIITRAVGSQEPLELDKVAGRLQPGDVLLLCTDGLSKVVSDDEIAQVLATRRPAEATRELVNLALLRGAPDNVSVVVVRVDLDTGTVTQPVAWKE